jgi:hypothetical protein
MSETELLREQVKEYINNADAKALRIVQAILEIEQEEDWWDELPGEVQTMLNAAIREDEEGKGIPHAHMVEKYSKWFKK